MAPPKMYRKMSRKIALWTVARTSSCGVRANLRTVRRATATELGQNPAPELTRACIGLGGEPVIMTASVMAILSGQAASGRLPRQRGQSICW
jgi:hypothetical protein